MRSTHSSLKITPKKKQRASTGRFLPNNVTSFCIAILTREFSTIGSDVKLVSQKQELLRLSRKNGLEKVIFFCA
jgi:hypothetical protein